jgi:hypothetical protein
VAFNWIKFRYPPSKHLKWREPDKQSLLINGGCYYFADMEWIEALLEIMDFNHRFFWQDEYALSWLIDWRHGGCPDSEFWLQHYENPLAPGPWRYSPWPSIRKRRESWVDHIKRETPIPFMWKRMFGCAGGHYKG